MFEILGKLKKNTLGGLEKIESFAVFYVGLQEMGGCLSAKGFIGSDVVEMRIILMGSVHNPVSGKERKSL